jgi:phosphate-selective porin OprO/OprP
MRSDSIRLAVVAVALAAALWLGTGQAALTADAETQQRFERLEGRLDTLENAVRERDAKIEGLERAVQERDAKIESLEQAGGQAAAASAARIEPAAGPPAVKGTDAALPMVQRLDALEGTVGSLKTEVSTVKTEQAKTAAAPKVTTSGGLKVETADGQFSFQPIGRLNYDAAFYDQDKSRMGDGSQVRRARLGVTGKMFGDWLYKLEADFARDTSAGTVGLKDAYLSYLGWDLAQITVGNFKEPFSINNLTSTNYLSFIERPLPITQPTTSLMPDRHLGIAASHYASNWSASIGAFLKHTDDAQPSNEGDQSFDVAGRITYEPIIEKDRLVHFGISGLFRNPDDASVAFSLKPESNVTGARFLNTSATLTALNPGQLASVDHLFMVDPEFAAVYGPASLMAEYFYVPITQTQHDPILNSGAAACRITSASAAAFSRCPDVALTGWYAELAYFLTGESRPYNAATARWDRLKPKHNLGKDGFGALELAARISHADFDDGADFQKGTETNYTVGLNWYVNPYIRFMMDYVWVRNNASALGNSANLLSGQANASYDDPQIVEFRAQVDW